MGVCYQHLQEMYKTNDGCFHHGSVTPAPNGAASRSGTLIRTTVVGAKAALGMVGSLGPIRRLSGGVIASTDLTNYLV